MSETREKVNDLAGAESADDISRRDTLSAELKAQEVELRTAIEADADTPPETREWADVSGPLRPGRDVHERHGAPRQRRGHR